MKNHPPTVENRAQIIEFSADTFQYRQERIKNLKSTTEVLQLFPRIVDTEGGVIVSSFFLFSHVYLRHHQSSSCIYLYKLQLLLSFYCIDLQRLHQEISCPEGLRKELPCKVLGQVRSPCQERRSRQRSSQFGW